MRSSIGMWVYPWDLADEGPDAVVAEAVDMGLNALSFASVYHMGRVLLPHNRRRRVWYPEDGAVYFQPDPHLYGRLIPPVSRLVQNRDLLGEAVNAARRSGVSVAFWSVCLHNGAIARAYPDCTLRNAYGDQLFNCLCPASADVREYVVALLKDLITRYGPDALDLESVAYLTWDPGFQMDLANVPVSPLAKFLLGLCFCPDCMATAKRQGIEGSQVQKWARESIDRALEGLTPEAEAEVWQSMPLQAGGAVGAWLAMRQRVVTEFHRMLVAQLPAGTLLRPFIFPLPEELWKAGIDLSAIGALHKALIVNCYGTAPSGILDRWQRYAAVTDPQWQRTCCVRVGSGFLASASDTQSTLVSLAAAGAAGCNFYNYGIMSATQLGWVQQAAMANREGN